MYYYNTIKLNIPAYFTNMDQIFSIFFCHGSRLLFQAQHIRMFVVFYHLTSLHLKPIQTMHILHLDYPKVEF